MQQGLMEQSVYDNTQSGKGRNSFFLCYVILTAIVYILPSVKISVPYVLAALLMIVSLPVLTIKYKEFFNFSLFLLLFAFYSTIRYAFFTELRFFDAINEGIRNIRFFLPVLWGVHALKNLNKKPLLTFMLFFLVMIFYMLFNTLIELEINPEISRLLAQGTASEEGSELNPYRMANIGGFEFSYMMGMFALCFIWLFLTKNNIWIRIISIVAYLVTFYYILQSQYTTLILLTFLGTIFLLYCLKKNMIFRVTIIILGLLCILFITDIFYFLGGLFEGTVLEVKFTRIATSIETGNIDDLGTRPQLIETGLLVWLRNPIFGAYDAKLNTHSLIINTIAQTGLIGIASWIYLICVSYRMIKEQLTKYENGTTLLSCVTGFLVLLSFLNPIGYVFEITIAAYFVIPVFIKLFAKEQEEQNDWLHAEE